MNRETHAAICTSRLWLVRTACGLAVGIMTCSHLMAAEATSARNDQLFEGQIRPLLLEKCVKCHGDDKSESGLRLDSRAALMQGGDSGPAIVPGDPAKSLLVSALKHDGGIEMPPGTFLPGDQIAVVEKWIEAGAPWPDEGSATTPKKTRSGEPTDEERRHWSFQPIADPPVPQVVTVGGAMHPIDAFLAAKLHEQGLQPVGPADRRTLVRRATFDLTGLPPAPADVDSFEADQSPDAFAQLVERLLASSAYGERWARHWLDVVRYADTAGETGDYPAPLAWKYRNYVIKAFNDDKPYDQFVREQVAGDLLADPAQPGRFAESVTATGYLAISRRFGFDSVNYMHLTYQDTIDTVGQSVLGLTLGCARCHDHKYDPITAADYYALYGIFKSTNYAFPGDEQTKRPGDMTPLVPADQLATLRKPYDEQLAAFDAEIKQAEEAKKPFVEQQKAEPENEELKQKIKDADAPIAGLKTKKEQLRFSPPFPTAYGVTDGKGENVKIQKRGEPTRPGDEVARRFLTVLGGDSVPADEPGSGRRQLADWLTRPGNPLTARVIVNRVWQHHFGQGLVVTENDFGIRGSAPTHPELLDWLASRFIEGGWSIKSLHRVIMSSQAYQRSCGQSEACVAVDPGNTLLWRFSRRRLDAEEIRDSILLVSGRLDSSPGEGHPFPPVNTWGYSQHRPFMAIYESTKRSIYLMTPRLGRHPFLALFDGADTNASTPDRAATTVPTQALFWMNDPLVHEESQAFARRLLGESDADARFELAYRTALARRPDAAEVAAGRGFVDRYLTGLKATDTPADQHDVLAWAAFARTLFASNEFLYID
jgi:Protein of unknown function (DUF1553)/Protein of unknown function (DUF1549)/Planctomycete cytochrome C